MEIAEGLHAFVWRDVNTNNCNTYLIDGPRRVLIDPGHRHLFGHVENELGRLGLTKDQIDMVICTHGHPDHVEAAEAFGAENTLVAIHREDWRLIEQLSKRMGQRDLVEKIRPSLFLKEGRLKIGTTELEVIETPGHSPGSICLYWPDRRVLITGDLVFAGGVGRTDLPGGSQDRLKASILSVAAQPAAVVLPGHGEIVSGRSAVESNFQRIESLFFNTL